MPFAPRHSSFVVLALTLATLAAAPPVPKPGSSKQAVPPAPAAAPTATPAAPIAKKPPAPTATTPLPGQRVSDAIEPAAKVILDRASQVAMNMRCIEVTTRGETIVWTDGKPNPMPLGPECHIYLEFVFREALFAPKMRVELKEGGTPRALMVFDGKNAIRLDLPTKLFMTSGIDWSSVGGDLLPSLPGWLLNERSYSLLRLTKQEGTEHLGERAAARVIGTETIDGLECDIVMSAIDTTQYNEDPSSAKAIKDGSAFVRIFETAAFARIDGLPRRIEYAPEIPGQGLSGGAERVLHYSALKLSDTLDAAVFSTAVPEGFTRFVAPATPEVAPVDAPPSVPEEPLMQRPPAVKPPTPTAPK